MSIEPYITEYKQIQAWREAGMLTYGETIARFFDLRERYLKGKGSWLLPVVR